MIVMIWNWKTDLELIGVKMTNRDFYTERRINSLRGWIKRHKFIIKSLKEDNRRLQEKLEGRTDNEKDRSLENNQRQNI